MFHDSLKCLAKIIVNSTEELLLYIDVYSERGLELGFVIYFQCQNSSMILCELCYTVSCDSYLVSYSVVYYVYLH